MKLSVAWLRELVELPTEIDAIVDRMTMLGLEVEDVASVGLSYPHVVVGHVLDAQPHPNADRLRVCRVSVGDGELNIVCGASNVRTGLKVLVAKPGAVLPGDFKIKKSKIRGEESHGMICSERELGLGDAHEGILELSEGDIGQPADALYGFQDTAIEIEVTPNRPDWLSHIGVARELGAFYEKPVSIPDVGQLPAVGNDDAGWRVDIVDRSACSLFTGRLVDGLAVGPSPLWLRHRLLSIGQRSINNVVDVSNLVLHECGQPNHVFDRQLLSGMEIRVRRATEGEKLTTLDATERELAAEHLVIADAEKAVALAGIMGGAETEVTTATTEAFVEVAVFDPRVVRKGRRRVNLVSDASYRFERGVDFNRVEWASQRVAQLLTQVAGAKASDTVIRTLGDAPPKPARFFVRASQVNRVVGVPIPPQDIAAMLGRLEIPASAVTNDGAPGVAVEQPSFRHDLLEEVDAVEEVARLYGYDRIEVMPHAPMVRPGVRSDRERFVGRVRERLAGRGYSEVVYTSFMNEQDPDRLNLPATDTRRVTVNVLNPLVVGEEALRTSLVPELLRIVDRNRKRGHTDPVRLFHLGRTFEPRAGETLPCEVERLALAWNGSAHKAHFDRPARDIDLYDVLGETENILESMGVDAVRNVQGGEPYHRNGAGVVIESRDGQRLGVVGEIAPSVRRAFDLDQATFVAEFDVDALVASGRSDLGFQRFSMYPPVRRDLSLLVPSAVPYAEVVGCLRESLDPLLESHEVFDLYEGEGIAANERAIGVRLVLRSQSGTLKDKKVDGMLSRLLTTLEQRHGARLRA